QQWRLGLWRISNIQRLNTNQTDGLYTADLKMRLTGGELGFDARVEVTYTLADEDLDWKLDFLASKGVDIVKTGRYNDCISANIEEDGWGGTQCLAIRNTTDTPLLVGGVRRSYDTWTKFVVTVPALGTATTGGLFAGGSVEDYEIHFVERDFQADE
ncbi:MAG: hypothetical protein IJ680_00380, partial [Paludibacteraceae bacterium]|nr:hypothetical protein [Paludibacteraceae bacterium]